MMSRLIIARFAGAAALSLGLATTFVTLAAERSSSTLRVGMPALAETLDPPRSNDPFAMSVMAGIYDTLYTLDPLARPATIVPVAAEGLPEISHDHRIFTIRVRRGIFFTPHASFHGKPRELTAVDFAYAFRRVFDPKIRSMWQPLIARKIEGLDALAERAQAAGTAIDYDAPVTGLEVVDPFTLRIRLVAPDPLFPFLLVNPLFAGVAREAIEADGENYGLRPVGTGAFIVAAYTPGQRVTLARNPGYRTLHWDDLLTPASRNAQGAHPMRGRKLPAVERIEISHTPEASAELLALRSGEIDFAYLNLPELATVNGRLRDDLAHDGLVLVRDPAPVSLFAFLNTRDPVVGGNTTEKIALRRAILMAFDDREWIRVLDAGFSAVREQVVPPGIEGYLAEYRNPNRFNPAAANALLDRFGYRRGPDGFRRNPDDTALTLHVLVDTKTQGRRRAEFAKRMLDRIGVRTTFESVITAEYLKRMSNSRFGLGWMEWGLDFPDGINPMIMFHSKSIGSVNFTSFVDAEFDAAYEKALIMPPGSQRTELFRAMQSRLDAYAPVRPMPFGDLLVLKRRGVVGPFATLTDWFQFMTLAVDGP